MTSDKALREPSRADLLQNHRDKRMKSCYLITVTGHPAMSVLCGFTSEGLPVGVQIVGRSQDELGVVRLAHAFAQATGFWKQAPSIAL